MIGSLLYVTASRPDVKQVVGMVARFQAAPKENHVQAVKIFFRYLKGTIDLGLWYPSKNSFSLKTYSDVDWAGCVDDRKMEEHSFWENHWYPGQARNYPQFLCIPLKLSIL